MDDNVGDEVGESGSASGEMMCSVVMIVPPVTGKFSLKMGPGSMEQGQKGAARRRVRQSKG
ncbi:MAG: hypothetical protein H7335_19895 [Massilia sp.]|nr:hypothetical protein [Massilia sp.]